MERQPIPATTARAAAEMAAAFLARDPDVRLVYLFGSAADPARSTVRDVDLAILADEPLAPDDLLRLRADVVAVAGAPIDLVSLHDAGIVLAHEVAESGRCLYARSPDDETQFVTRSRARYWDWRPFRELQWRMAAERLEDRRRGA